MLSNPFPSIPRASEFYFVTVFLVFAMGAKVSYVFPVLFRNPGGNKLHACMGLCTQFQLLTKGIPVVRSLWIGGRGWIAKPTDKLRHQ